MSDIPFSKMYIHDLKALYTQHEEKEITDEELSQRSDQLKQREAQLHGPIGDLLLKQELIKFEKEIADEVKKEIDKKRQEEEYKEQAFKAREAFLEQQKLQKLRDEARKKQQQELQEQAKIIHEEKQREQNRYDFKNEIDDYVNRLEKNAQDWQFRYTWLQIILLFFSAITATMAGIEGVPRWVVAITGVIATIAGSLLTTFKIQDRIYASRRAIAEIRLECQKYEHHIEEYTKLNDEEAFIHFSRNITLIQGQQMIQEVELWNPEKDKQKEDISTLKGSQESLQEDLTDQASKDVQETQEKPPSQNDIPNISSPNPSSQQDKDGAEA